MILYKSVLELIRRQLQQLDPGWQVGRLVSEHGGDRYWSSIAYQGNCCASLTFHPEHLQIASGWGREIYACFSVEYGDPELVRHILRVLR